MTQSAAVEDDDDDVSRVILSTEREEERIKERGRGWRMLYYWCEFFFCLAEWNTGDRKRRKNWVSWLNYPDTIDLFWSLRHSAASHWQFSCDFLSPPSLDLIKDSFAMKQEGTRVSALTCVSSFLLMNLETSLERATLQWTTFFGLAQHEPGQKREKEKRRGRERNQGDRCTQRVWAIKMCPTRKVCVQRGWKCLSPERGKKVPREMFFFSCKSCPFQIEKFKPQKLTCFSLFQLLFYSNLLALLSRCWDGNLKVNLCLLVFCVCEWNDTLEYQNKIPAVSKVHANHLQLEHFKGNRNKKYFYTQFSCLLHLHLSLSLSLSRWHWFLCVFSCNTVKLLRWDTFCFLSLGQTVKANDETGGSEFTRVKS